MAVVFPSATYPTLSTYEVLAASGITTVNTTTVNNGFYGTPAGVGITGAYVATGAPSGLDGANATVAQTELTALRNAIASYVAGLGNAQAIPAPVLGVSTLSPATDYTANVDIDFATDGITEIVFDAGGDPDAQFFITTTGGATSDIIFSNVTMTLLNGACAGNIYFVSAGAITFTTMGNDTVYGNMIAQSSVTSATGTTFNGRLFAQTAAVTFSGTTQANAILCSTPEPEFVVCYAEGTKVFTENGYVPIEDLKTGDKVIVNGTIINNAEYEPSKMKSKAIVWKSKFSIHTGSTDTMPVCIQKDALGENMPFEDLYVSPGHAIVVDGQIMLAKDMINGTTIVQKWSSSSVTYHHVEFESHYSIFANGIVSESYVDTNTRYMFEESKRVIPRKMMSGWYAAKTCKSF